MDLFLSDFNKRIARIQCRRRGEENEKLYINFSIDSFVCDWICHHEKYRQFYRK